MRKFTESAVVIALSVAPLVGMAAVAPQPAAAAPYGGCAEAWQAPRSAGAQECRELGWTVRPRIVVGPANVVRYSRLPSCTYEDASSGPLPCSWNFRTTDGNGHGRAFWVTGTHEAPRFRFVRLP